MDSTPFWDGKLPFDQRQSIEDYQEQVEPLVGRVVSDLEALGSGKLSRDPSELQGCGAEGTEGYEVSGARIMGGPVDVSAAVSAIDAVLVPAHFAEKTDGDDDDSSSVKWFDPDNGGYFSLTVVPGSHTSFSYLSGCRPSNGATTDRIRDRVTPAWENAIPLDSGSAQSGD